MIPYLEVAGRGLSESITSDDIRELHAARMLLLISRCGKNGELDGLTKMAKLDFFARYPTFFEAIVGDKLAVAGSAAPESPMIRYHYGPWDTRYYDVLGFLVSRGLLRATKQGKKVVLQLTGPGKAAADRLATKAPYADLVNHMDRVGQKLGKYSGSHLKELIYKEFAQEIGDLRLGELIE